MLSTYQDVYCAGGVCGLVLQAEDKEHCPEPCNTFTQCSSCLKHAHCGWCALPGLSGEGVCTEGSNEKPMLGTCLDIFVESNGKISVRKIFLCYYFYTFIFQYTYEAAFGTTE